MIHQYKNNGYNIVLDVNSGSVHVVDDIVYDVIACMVENHLEHADKETVLEGLKKEFADKTEELDELVDEIYELKENGMLFTEDIYEKSIDAFRNRETVVKALCLHIAHDCNLKCRYCFAEEGEYHGRRALMSYEVGKKALDFLVANSGSRKNLEVDFFGGEPLMNFDVVRELVAYARSIEKEHNKKFRFTLTTNGLLIDDDVIEFANQEMSNVVLSLDGRKEIHDKMRIRQTIMCAGRLRVLTRTLPRMSAILPIWDLSRFPLSRSLPLRARTMHLCRRTFRRFLRSMISWLSR